jgi:hypothetical protein
MPEDQINPISEAERVIAGGKYLSRCEDDAQAVAAAIAEFGYDPSIETLEVGSPQYLVYEVRSI